MSNKQNTNDSIINNNLNIDRTTLVSELQQLDYLLKSLEHNTILVDYDAVAEQELIRLLDASHSPRINQLFFIAPDTRVEKPGVAALLASLIEGAALSMLLLGAFAIPITIPLQAATAGTAAATAITVGSIGSLITGSLLFGSWFFCGRSNAHKFSSQLDTVKELYDDGIKNNDLNKLVRAETVLSDMFCLEKNDKSFMRFFRWFYIPQEAFALAHYIHAEIGLNLNKNYALEEFETAIKDTSDNKFDRITRLREAALLLSKQRKIALQPKISSLVQKDSSKIYFAHVNKAYANIIAAINSQDAELTHYTMSKFLLLENIEIIQQLENGDAYLALFTYVKSLCAAEIYSNPLTKSSEKDKLKIEYLNLLISCHQQIKQQDSSQFDDLLNTIRTQCETKLHAIENHSLPHSISQKLITLGIKEDPKARLSEANIVELLADTSKPVKSLLDLLIKIVTDESFAKMQFADDKNWLHYLPRIDFPFELRNDARMATAYIIAQGVSPYARDKQHKTAFQYIPSPDHNCLEPLLRPAAEGADFIGLDNQKESLYNFLQRPINNPYTKNRLLLLAGPPGVGKTELTKVIAAKAGYKVLEFHGGSAEDKWLGGREARVREFFSNAIEQNEPVVLFMDEIDSICSETKDAGPGNTFKDELSNLLQTLIDQLAGSQVVVIGTTNYLDKVKKAIRSRAGIPVHFYLPNEQQRAKIIEDKLRLISIDDVAIIADLAMETHNWSPRDLEKYLLDVQETAERKNRNCLTAQDFANVMVTNNGLLTKTAPTSLFGYNANKAVASSNDELIKAANGTRPHP